MTDNSDDVIGHDLWGEPVYRVRRKRGRPPFEWTEENSHKVSMLLAMGWTNDRIAGVVLDPRTGKPISVPTLKRHFRTELQVRDAARDLLLSKQMMQAMGQAEGGNVGAMRFFQQLVEKNDARLASARLRESDAPKDKHPPGKKELARARAREVAGGEADPVWGSDLKPGFRH